MKWIPAVALAVVMLGAASCGPPSGEVLQSDEPFGAALAVNGSFLAWSFGASNGTRMGIAGMSLEDRKRKAFISADSVEWIAVDTDWIYWVTNQELWRMNRAGGPPVLAQSYFGDAIAVGDGFVYGISESSAEVKIVSTDGGDHQARTVLGGAPGRLRQTEGTGIAVQSGWLLGGAEESAVVAGRDFKSTLPVKSRWFAADDDNVYAVVSDVNDHPTEIDRIALPSLETTRLTTLSPNDTVHGFVLTANRLVWLNEVGRPECATMGCSNPNELRLESMRKDGTQRYTVAAGDTLGGVRLVADDGAAFWTSGRQLFGSAIGQ